MTEEQLREINREAWENGDNWGSPEAWSDAKEEFEKFVKEKIEEFRNDTKIC